MCEGGWKAPKILVLMWNLQRKTESGSPLADQNPVASP